MTPAPIIEMIQAIDPHNETDTDELEVFLTNDNWIDDPDEGQRLLCCIRSLVARSLDMMPSDCVCEERVAEKIRMFEPITRSEWARNYFRNDGRAVRFVAEAVIEKLAREVEARR